MVNAAAAEREGADKCGRGPSSVVGRHSVSPSAARGALGTDGAEDRCRALVEATTGGGAGGHRMRSGR